jgi:hypothetical protein
MNASLPVSIGEKVFVSIASEAVKTRMRQTPWLGSGRP